MKKLSIILVILLSFLLGQTEIASAGLVQCFISSSQNALCSFCSFLATIQAVINFVITLALLIAVALIAKLGLDMFFTGGDVGKVTKALNGIKSVIIGVLIVLAAWAIINTIIVFLARPGSPPTFWNKLSC